MSRTTIRVMAQLAHLAIIRIAVGLAVLLALVIPAQALATSPLTGVFYQPQQRDMDLPPPFWQQTFAEIRNQGFNTIIFQWSRYGEVFAKGEEQIWLQARVNDALAAELNIVMGLYADPDAFSAMQVPTDLLEPYFLRVGQKNLELVQQWQTFIKSGQLTGWYLPFEIDDRRWRATQDQSVLSKQLHREASMITALSDKPIYVSSFFRGNSTPNQYAKLIKSLQQSTGLQIWVQDGTGAAGLGAVPTKRYIDELTDCKDPVASGLVYELFKQTGPDGAFKANPLSPQKLNRVSKQRAPCDMDTTFFSLRYLIPFSQ